MSRLCEAATAARDAARLERKRAARATRRPAGTKKTENDPKNEINTSLCGAPRCTVAQSVSGCGARVMARAAAGACACARCRTLVGSARNREASDGAELLVWPCKLRAGASLDEQSALLICADVAAAHQPAILPGSSRLPGWVTPLAPFPSAHVASNRCAQLGRFRRVCLWPRLGPLQAACCAYVRSSVQRVANRRWLRPCCCAAPVDLIQQRRPQVLPPAEQTTVVGRTVHC